MDKTEANALLGKAVARYREKPYAELASLVEEQFRRRHTQREEIKTDKGKWYQITVNVYWDDKAKGVIRVVGAIDDGGWRAFMPLTDGFLISPNGVLP
jgi:hypothetical protein